NHLSAARSKSVRHGRRSGAGSKADYSFAIGHHSRLPFNGLALSKRLRSPAGGIHTPYMPPLHIILVRCIEDLNVIGREFHVLNIKFAGSEQQRLSASGRNGVKMIAAILLRA